MSSDYLCACGHDHSAHDIGHEGQPNYCVTVGGCPCTAYRPMTVSDDPATLARLKNHDPAELNAVAALVTQGADPERHPLFSVRYRIAVTILESEWLRERDAQNWDEGFKHRHNEGRIDPTDPMTMIYGPNPYRSEDGLQIQERGSDEERESGPVDRSSE